MARLQSRTTNKSLNQWGKVLHDQDLAAAILDRVLERGRLLYLDGHSGRTRHLKLEDDLLPSPASARISGIGVPEFPEPTSGNSREELVASYLYQVHLYHWLETNDYGRFLIDNDL